MEKRRGGLWLTMRSSTNPSPSVVISTVRLLTVTALLTATLSSEISFSNGPIAFAAALTQREIEAGRPEKIHSDRCHTFSTCAECAYDSTGGILGPFQTCSWCASSGVCVPFGGEAEAKCPDVRSQFGGEAHNKQCPDMGCAAAYIVNNVYFCRGTNIAAFVLSLVLILISALYYVWLRGLQQMPWRYPRIHAAVSAAAADSSLLGMWGGGPSAPEDAPSDAVQRASMNTNGPQCPVCKLAQPAPLGPGEVCYWAMWFAWLSCRCALGLQRAASRCSSR